MDTRDKRLFFVYTGLIFVLTTISFTLLYGYKLKDAYYNLIRVYNLLDYWILAYFFSLHIKNKIFKKGLLFSIIPFTIFCISDFLSTGKPSLPYFPLAIEYVCLLVFILYFFFEVMQNTVSEPIYQKGVFWISVAFIINFSGNFFLFLYSKNSYNNNADFQKYYVIIYGTITIIKNILLCISARTHQENTTPHSEINNLESPLPF
jgi:hypothetical protein